MGTTILEWSAKEFEHHHKGVGWYITLVIVSALLILYTLIIKDYFASLTIFIITIVVFIFAALIPENINIAVGDKGIMINELAIPYTNIRRFWIVDHAEARTVHIETTAYLNRIVILQLEEQDPEEVRTILSNFILEDQPNQESLAHRIARKLKF